MTEEQMQNTMQFIIEHQARFAADMEVLKELASKTDERIRTLTDAMLSLARVTEENENLLKSLAKETGERFRETDQKIARLAELGEGTEARLNAFIAFVEKYIAGPNGGRE
jgi:predicted RNase H-like nuclease (RuvC/YqgF family)